MNTRLELIQRALSGDPSATYDLIEHNQAIVYRLALSLLEDPVEAVEVTRETFVAALGGLATYSGKIAFPSWLYDITVRQVRQRLRQRRLLEHLPQRLQTQFRREKIVDRPAGDQSLVDRDHLVTRLASRLEDRLRLPFILFYDHGLTVHEIAPMFDQKARVVQSCLAEARGRLRGPLAIDPLGSHEAEDNLREHQRAQKLIETDGGLITDEDNHWLKEHLKACDPCQAYAQRTKLFEDELCAILHRRWDSQPGLPVNFAATVIERIHHRTFGYHTTNLAKAVAVGLAAIAIIVFLPSIDPPEVLSPLATSSATAALPKETFSQPLLPTVETHPYTMPATPAPGISPARRYPDPTPAPLTSNPELIYKIYPGKLAYVPLRANNFVLMTMLPDGSEIRPVRTGFSDNLYPVWSPDGRQIAFLGSSSQGSSNQVLVMEADGSNLRLVSRNDLPGNAFTISEQSTDLSLAEYSYGRPRWSPDGKTIAVPLKISYTLSYLALLAVDGSRAVYMPVEGLDYSLVAWSPDGRTIAYAAKKGEDLWEWKPDQPARIDENPLQIRSDTRWDSTYGLSWSPDSDQIALMVGNNNNEYVEVNLRIFQRSTGKSRLIPLSSGILSRPSFLSDNLSWSPDGKYLAYFPVYSEAGKNRIMLVRPDGKDWTQRALVDVNWGLNGFTWSPDGRWMAVSAGSQVWGVSLEAFEMDETALVELASMEAYALNWQKVN